MTAAAACIAAALVIVPIKTGYFSEAGLDISAGDTFTPREISKEYVEENIITRANIRIEIPATVDYNIIVGSFKDFGNARQLRNNLVDKGFQARILAADNGFYRVSAGQSSAREDANLVLASARTEGYDSAWLLSN